VINNQGHRDGISVSVRDVTRRMELEHEIAEAQKMSALGTMAGAVAHHFNNFLGGIITSLDFAQTSDNPESLRRALQTTVKALSRANELTRSLLAFSEGARSDTSTEEISSTVERFIASVQPRLADHNIILETDLQPVASMVPAQSMQTILKHLTDNACEAMKEGGTLRIELGLSQDHRHVLLHLCDTGHGMPANELLHVFEPFYTSKEGHGADPSMHAGLGLAVVHGIVKELGGTVSLSCATGSGTVCRICLPAKK